MSSFTLASDKASVTVDEHASEIHSFKSKETGFEYMWQGDPAFWKGRNPTLFPMVGSTWDKVLHIKGKEYHTGNHGFTRNSDFTCIKHDEKEIVMELRDSKETLEQYPYAFTLRITYMLDGATLSIHYAITNENDEVMPFNFGLHPAFNCPINPAGRFEDCYIELGSPETFTWKTTTLNHETKLPLNKDALADTVIITEPRSTSASLTDGTHGVKVGFDGYRWLAFWSPNAPFVCIEPWYSHADFEKVEVPFEKREGTQFLDPHDTFEASYTITVF